MSTVPDTSGQSRKLWENQGADSADLKALFFARNSSMVGVSG